MTTEKKAANRNSRESEAHDKKLVVNRGGQ